MKKIQKKILFLLPAVLLTACSPAKKQQTETPVETSLSAAVDAPVTQESAENSREDSLPDEETGNAPETKEQDTTAQTETQAGNRTAGEEFHAEDVYVMGNPILSDCLFLEVNMSDIEKIESNLKLHNGEELADGGYFIYGAGEGITYVTHSSLNGGLYAVILTTDQFQLGCGLKVGMKEDEIASLRLPFVPCNQNDYPMDSSFLEDADCPLNTMDYDRIYLYQFGGIPEEAVKKDSILSGGRISITALVKDGVVISVFTNIPVAG